MNAPILYIFALAVLGLLLSEAADMAPFAGMCGFAHGDSWTWVVVVLGLFALAWVWVADFSHWLRKKERRPAFGFTMVAPVLFYGVFLGAHGVADHLRTAAIEDFAVRMTPLVEALNGYTSAHGTPDSLAAVGPSHVPAVPELGICPAGELEYARGGPSVRPTIGPAPPWSLQLALVRNHGEGDYLVYRSDGRYRNDDEVVAGWARLRWTE